ncbi:MAG: hypothetical protein ACFFE5_12795 [Candidatus Thorarchaeota archaeon]
MQFLAYSILIFRPVFAAITDKYKIKGYQRKFYIVFSGYSLALIYFLMGLTLSNLIIFGLFLLLIYISSTMLDVSSKSLVIDISPTSETKKRYLFFIYVGEALGKFFPFFLFFLLVNDISSLNSWSILISSSYFLLIPLLSILPFINEKVHDKSRVIENSINSNNHNNKDLNLSLNFKKTFIFLCIFMFFAFSDVIFAYPFFPYLLNKFGQTQFNFFNFLLIFYFIVSISSSAIGSFFLKRLKPKKIICFLIPVIGIIYVSFNFVPFALFVILYFIGSSLGTITNLNISVYIMKFKKGNKSLYFHLIASFRHISTFIFIPLGTLLSIFISMEFLIIIGAIFLNISLLPLLFIKL